jgi:hypothetical protein
VPALLCAALCGAPLTSLAASPQTTGLPAPNYYANLRSVVDWSPSELLQALPELRGYEPAQSQEALPSILQRVGENVAAFFRDFPNTTSVERIRQERLYRRGGVEDSRSQKFYYLSLAPSDKTRIGLEEFRTDKKARPIELQAMEVGPSVVTKGFASMSIHLHPVFQPDSTFRYLGRQKIDGVSTEVVAFAQKPESARMVGRVNTGTGSATVLVQGVAWIDPIEYQILRLRTDLLTPRPDIGLQRQTTEIHFGEVRFKDVPTLLWLPQEVVVTMKWNGQSFRNLHQYSDFKLFNVEAEGKLKPVETELPKAANPK